MRKRLAALLMMALLLTSGTALADIYMLTAEELASIPMTMADTPENVPVTYKVTQQGSDAEDSDLGLIMSTDTGTKLREIDASVPSKHEGGIAFNYNEQALVIKGPDEYSRTITMDNWKNSDAPVTFYTTNTKENGRWGATDGAAIYPENKLEITPNRNKFILETNDNTKKLKDGQYTATLTLKAMDESNYNLIGSAVIKFTVRQHEHTLTYTDHTPSAHYIKCSDPDCQVSSGTYTQEHEFETLPCGTKRCKLCKGTYPPNNVKHSGGEATCKDRAMCQYCGREYGPLGKHKFNESEWVKYDESWHTHPCEVCDEVDQDNLRPHTFSDSYDPVCNDCEYERKIEPGTVTIEKKLSGIDPEDLPDGTEFVFEVFDNMKKSLGIKQTITKEMLVNGNNIVVATIDREMNVIVGERISSTQIDGYTCETTQSGYEWNMDASEEYFFAVEELVRAGYNNDVVFCNAYTPVRVDMPQTGDESDMLLWLSLALSSMAALVLIARKKREA